MDISIDTKFSIGDEVWYICDISEPPRDAGRSRPVWIPRNGRILSLRVNVYEDGSNDIEYDVGDPRRKKPIFHSGKYFSEEDLYTTQRECKCETKEEYGQ